MDTVNVPDLTAANWAELHRINEAYVELRERVMLCLRANDGVLLGSARWLRHAIEDEDCHLTFGPYGITVSGSAYTSQTMENESFEIFVSFEDLAAV